MSVPAVFSDIAREYYPGSSHPIERHPNRAKEEHRKIGKAVDPDWDANPRHLSVNGVPTEFFTIGHLAKALGRKPVTIRLWEREGVIPVATYQVNSEKKEGRRRLYTRDQILGLVRIAYEEGILVTHQRAISSTQFTVRAIDLFKELAASLLEEAA